MVFAMKRWVLGGIFAACSLTQPTMTSAGTPLIYKDGDRPVFGIEVPDFWSVRTGGLRDLTDPNGELRKGVSRVLGLTPQAHDGIWVGFVSPHDVRTLDEGRDYLREIGKFLVAKSEISKTTNRQINRLPAQTIAGTGQRDGKSVNFTAVIIDLPNGRVAVSVVVLEAGADPDVVRDINKMMSSFRAMR